MQIFFIRNLIHFIAMPTGGRHRGPKGLGHYQAYFDSRAARTVPATLMAGIYTFKGNEMWFRSQSVALPTVSQDIMQQNMMMEQNTMMMMNNLQQNSSETSSVMGQEMMQVNMMNMVPQQTNVPIQQGNITIFGSKTKPGDLCCVIATQITGACFIVPLFFMCCTWWKKIALPMYQLKAEAYRDIAAFIERNPTMNYLNLTVADNSFNAEKAIILHEALSRSRITGFSFLNMALACNLNSNQADDFIRNVAPIKSLSITTSLTWGDMIA